MHRLSFRTAAPFLAGALLRSALPTMAAMPSDAPALGGAAIDAREQLRQQE
ncbi:hypothetical protein [Erwinia piriflorinigrans]|uniref:Uncharacterized protein n=1 Tax=Erwinia piriflorinigrans CFBP 5888 TaxID=1161919 RepID=V5ZB78_9GAMM|nr:hypothetical protein EPIR_3127 [Erwinia piriflorinigrans CFBP 5888]